jgi:hypothetical protein
MAELPNRKILLDFASFGPIRNAGFSTFTAAVRTTESSHLNAIEASIYDALAPELRHRPKPSRNGGF